MNTGIFPSMSFRMWKLDLSAQGFGKLVRQQQNFQPVPLKQIQDSRLQDFLARFE